ncbi:MAG: hypothetical protein CYPHOPRED_001395 [Cyphobasidiales sp. Tagirdzhanova-0007]|nr:MAG: hypothetical protein CYPHOPRED_001395 [Cyphobasidiales sp. Tagirdzhanova-0007]
MDNTLVSIQGQKASLLADASLDHENRVGLENQISGDQGTSLGTTLREMVTGKSSISTEGLPTDTRSKSTNLNQATPKTIEKGDIPTGLDAIKAGGAQGKSHAYCEPH